MSWKEINDINQFKKLALSICAQDESKYSLLLGMALNLEKFGSHIMLSYNDKSIALQTNPLKPMVISDMNEKTAFDFAQWLENHLNVKEVVGTKETMHFILDQSRTRSPGYPELLMDQRIFKLTKLTKPDIKYKMRAANPKDLFLVADWFYQFMIDAFINIDPDKAKIEKLAQTRINNNEVYLLIQDGNIVSMACHSRPTQKGITVNGVFTPIEHRGNHYATQIVALLSEKLLETYDHCCLYTDLTNPASNKIYENIGYQAVCDSLHYKIDD